MSIIYLKGASLWIIESLTYMCTRTNRTGLFNAVLGVLMSAITPYVTAMADNVGISLPYIDIGWQGASVVVYSNTLGYIYLVLGLGLNLLLFALKLVDTFQPTDIWNYYQFVFWADRKSVV